MAGATLSLYAVPALLVTLLGFFALAASVLQRRIPKDTNALADRIERMLPLTQCAQCGHPGCRPYADAVAAGEAIDLCPPGGVELIAQLKDLMGDDAPQTHGDMATAPPIVVAVIDEAACIGCTLCLDPCPVDAIVGARGLSRPGVEQYCCGCDLCIAPCPVDCISLETKPAPLAPAPVPLLGRGCINCGQCIDACPVALQPDQLVKLSNAQEWAAAEALDLQRCIECGLCDRVCPSEINLAARFTDAKRTAAAQTAVEAEKQRIKTRYTAHQQRLIAVQHQADNRRADRLAKLRGKRTPSQTADATDGTDS